MDNELPAEIELKIEAAAQKWESATQHEGLGPSIFKAGVDYAMAYAKVTCQQEIDALQAKCDKYEAALKDVKGYTIQCLKHLSNPDHTIILQVIDRALSAGEGEKEMENE